jgi:organic radical activating enzyme
MQRYFPPHQPVSAGIFQFTAPPESEFPHRLHLRVEPDGRGLLVVNGSTVVHLNQTAAEYTYHLIKATPSEEAARSVSQRYGIEISQAREDYQGLTDRIRGLIEVPDLDPVTYLDFDRDEMYSGESSAPYRLDCALTYRLPETGYARYAPVDRVKQELPQSEWQAMLKKAWDAGIPHVVFTGGEPTLRPDLPDLIAYASQLGMVTGLITNGVRLAERDYLHQILQSGLDHVMIILDTGDDATWEALRDVLAEDLAVTVHLSITRYYLLNNTVVFDRLVNMGVKAVSISASSRDLDEFLVPARQAAAERQLRLVYDLPVPYSRLNPVALELVQAGEDIPQGAGKAWLYVEPDGDVLPAQGILELQGNLLNDSWDVIWKQPAD